MRNLEGQIALITGGSSGIGSGIAIALAEAGAAVVICYRSDDAAANETASKAAAAGGRAIVHRCDVSLQDDVVALFERTVAELGAIDILVNNAGIQADAKLEEMTIEQWRRVIDTNLTGYFLCAREAVKAFKKRGVRSVSKALGKILFVSSVHEVIPWGGHVNYAASKGGVMMLMKSIAQEVAPHAIRVNSIAPGAIRTDINRDAWSTPEALDALLKLIPYGRIGEVEDVARAARWILSDEADYVTGTTLFVDGGMALYPGFEAGG